MTSRQMYEALLIELNKTDAPNILLEDFNYFANKAIYQYINKRYNIYDINQQTTDDLRVLKATARLTPTPVNQNVYEGLTNASLATYECILPSDYLHMLNCICVYEVKKTYKCYNKGDKWRAAAKRLTADAYSQVLDNFWNRPTYKKPYYYIHNVNTNFDTKNQDQITYASIPTNEKTDGKIYSFKFKFKWNDNTIIVDSSDYTVEKVGEQFLLWTLNTSNSNVYYFATRILHPKSTGQIWLYDDPLDDDPGNIDENITSNKVLSNFDDSEVFTDKDSWNNYIVNTSAQKLFTSVNSINNNGSISISNVERGGQIRYGNASQVRMEIRYGTDKSIFELVGVLVDYIKAPQYIRLTQEQLDWTEDTSQMLEYPDYVCQEIINELVHIVMENIGDPKLQTHPIVSQSIANPAQQQTEPVAQAT